MRSAAILRGRTSRRSMLAGVLLSLGVLVAPPAIAAGPSGADTVRNLYGTLLECMQSGPALGLSGRYARIEPVVQRVFDVRFMARLAVGPEWERLNNSKRQQVSQAFARYIAAVYAERFDSYAGEALRVTGEQPTSTDTVVTSDIVKSNGEPVQISYLLRQNGAAWQIIDVYLNGTISELATRRSEFGSILRAQGIDGLIVTLNAKADTLAARPS